MTSLPDTSIIGRELAEKHNCSTIFQTCLLMLIITTTIHDQFQVSILYINMRSLMAELKASQGIYCTVHDLEAMGSNPGQELWSVLSTLI